MSSVVAPIERLVQQFQIWRYQEQSVACERRQRDVRERLTFARSSHLH